MSQGSSGRHCVEQLALLLYGELSFEDEDRVESHLAECAECRSALQQTRELSATLDAVGVEPSPALLRQARENLFARLEQEPPVGARPGQDGWGASWWDRLVEFAAPRLPSAFLRPAGALALVAMGFTAARVEPSLWPAVAFGPSGSSANEMSLLDPGAAARVRYVARGANGGVQIVLDETRQRVVSGSMEDETIRALLLAATKDPSDPGLRAETMQLLASRQPGSGPEAPGMTADVKAALIYAVRTDQNAGVRLKALEGLKAIAGDAEVRAALSDVLLSDSNPGMRNQAIDLLLQGLENGDTFAGDMLARPGFPPEDARMVSLFQELMKQGEKNHYVRQRSQRALELVNAIQEEY